jgi:hypothetical protein
MRSSPAGSLGGRRRGGNIAQAEVDRLEDLAGERDQLGPAEHQHATRREGVVDVGAARDSLQRGAGGR